MERAIEGRIYDAIRLAGLHAQQAIRGTASVDVVLNTLPTDVIVQLTATLREGPVRKILDQLPVEGATRVREALLRGVALGLHPSKIARDIETQAAMAFQRAQTIARTEVLRAYRYATLQHYRSNQEFVKGWRWVAALSPRTCHGCLAMHGREFELNETIHDHPNGRCTIVPVTPSWQELGITRKTPPEPELPQRERWFWNLPRDMRERILGPARYEALRSGQLGWGDMVFIRPTRFGRVVVARRLGYKGPEFLQRAREVRKRIASDPWYGEVLDLTERIAGFLESRRFVVSRPESGWRGNLEIDDVPFRAAFHGPHGKIILSANVKSIDGVLVHTLLHELLHAVGHERGRLGYNYDLLGYEEGFVEMMTRRLRRQFLEWARLPLEWDRQAEEKYENHPYVRYIEMLEQIRKIVKKSPEEFYDGLITQTAWRRQNQVDEWAREIARGDWYEYDRLKKRIKKIEVRMEVEAMIQGVLYD